jgi:hypothetical protein
VSLIDAMISIARVLVGRDMSSNEVQEALADLRDDEDIAAIVAGASKPQEVPIPAWLRVEPARHWDDYPGDIPPERFPEERVDDDWNDDDSFNRRNW